MKADSRSVWVPLIVATAFAWSAMACSAGEDNKDPAPGTGGKPGAAGAAGAGATPGAAGAGIDVPGQGGAGNKPPPSKEVGTEALPCNGVDDNDNGIIDDIDVGKDGVCDCLSIAVFGNSGKEADNSSFATWLKARGSREPVYIDAEAALTAEALKGIHVLVVQDLSLHPEVSDAEVKALTDWVNAGGGVMTMSGYQAVPSDATMTNALLANTGLSYDISMGGAGVLGGGAPPLRLPAIVDPKHPLTAGITLVGVYYAYPVQGDGTEIFKYKDYVLGQAKDVGEGRAFVFGDEWITYDSLWMQTDNAELQTARLWLNIMSWLTPKNECKVAIPDDIF